MSRTQRVLDFVFVLVFLFFLFASLLFDVQLVLPDYVYGEDVKSLLKSYIESYKDPLYSDPPVWFLAFLKMELVLWNPFYVAAIYAFARGRYWIRIPAIMYAVSVITVVVPCIAYIQGTDFYYHYGAAPHTEEERAVLVQQLYGPLGIFALVLLITMFMRKPVIKQVKDGTSNTQQYEQNAMVHNANGGSKKDE